MSKPVEELVYTETTRDIRVSVVPAYVPDGYDPSIQGFVFTYTVTIENCGNEQVKLLDRHWLISSSGTLFDEVKGEGVVGEQPEIAPGEGFQYSSWAVINDPAGAMRGTYGFRSSNGETFRVSIPEFHLMAPHVMH